MNLTFEWLPLTWDAVAVFATGSAAVAGAVVVGWRQAKITGLQTELLRDQIENDHKLRLNEIKLKLMDQRAQCIGDIKHILGAFHSSSTLSGEDRIRLFEAIQRAELIFEAETIKGLNDVAWNSVRVVNKYRLADSHFRKGNEAKADEANNDAHEMMDEIYQSLPELVESMVVHSRISHFE